MALPSLSSGAAAAIAGAVAFGGTFMGIVTLTMTAARALAPGATGRAVGTLTAAYGVGQAIGPFAAGALSRRLGGDPRPAVVAAAVAVAVGGLVLAWPRRRAGADPAHAVPEEERCRT